MSLSRELLRYLSKNIQSKNGCGCEVAKSRLEFKVNQQVHNGHWAYRVLMCLLMAGNDMYTDAAFILGLNYGFK